jgi:hypothetical protein
MHEPGSPEQLSGINFATTARLQNAPFLLQQQLWLQPPAYFEYIHRLNSIAEISFPIFMSDAYKGKTAPSSILHIALLGYHNKALF